MQSIKLKQMSTHSPLVALALGIIIGTHLIFYGFFNEDNESIFYGIVIIASSCLGYAFFGAKVKKIMEMRYTMLESYDKKDVVVFSSRVTHILATFVFGAISLFVLFPTFLLIIHVYSEQDYSGELLYVIIGLGFIGSFIAFFSLSAAWTKMEMTTSRLYFTSMFGYDFMPFSIPMIKSVEQRWKFFRLDTEFGLITWLIWSHKSFIDSLRQVNPRVVLIGQNSSIDGKQPSESRRMVCNHCGAIVGVDNIYCSKCGTSLSDISDSEVDSANIRTHHAS